MTVRIASAILCFFWAFSLLHGAELPGIQTTAALKLAPIFRDHMVLQQNAAVPVWGTSRPGDKIIVQFAGQTKLSTADEVGRWKVQLDPMPACAEPRQVLVQSGENHSLKFSDVLVGEVWICSGQSNMEWIMGKLEEFHFPGVEHGDEEIAKPERAQIRIFTDDISKHWGQRGWQLCGNEALRRFSATAFFFGDFLQRDLKVPVGLINLSRGGSPVHAWTPREFGERNPYTKQCLELYQRHREAIEAWNKVANEARKAGKPMPEISQELDLARRFHSNAELFEKLVEPVVPYAARGVIWYQGEASGCFPELAAHYGSMLRDLIEGWRTRWQNPDLPFYLVQLPCWEHPETVNWPGVRQGQWQVAETMPNVGLAAICDVADVHNLHPPQKKETGERLARVALARTYGKAIPFSGPKLKSLRREGTSLVATFDNPEVRDGAWNDVELSGGDGVFHPAQAVVEGGRAVITCKECNEPKMLRYGWKGVFTPSLFSKTGLPAPPFMVEMDGSKVVPAEPIP